MLNVVQTPSVVVEKRRSMFLSRRRSNKSQESSIVTTIDENHSSNILTISCRSLATGSFSASGVFSITPSVRSNAADILDTFSQSEDDDDDPPLTDPVGRIASSRVFIRTADLPHMKLSVRNIQQSLSPSKFPLLDYFHQPSSDPPLPTIPHDVHESWVALDDGTTGMGKLGGMAPLAPAVTSALVQTGLEAAMTKSMWTPNGPTMKLLSGGKWDGTIFQSTNDGRPVPVPHARGSKEENDALVWVGEFGHKYYGHDIPAARCEGIVNMSPRELVDLLLDSSRVKEYNKMSIGREDIMIFCNDVNRVTKIIVGRSKPPLLGKTLVLKSLLHMEELPAGSGGGGSGGSKQHCGYVIVSRAIVLKDDLDVPVDPKVLNSEMLMGLNIIRAIEGEEDRCVLINLNHLRSPMIPVYLAKKLALGAAVNFLNDIRTSSKR